MHEEIPSMLVPETHKPSERIQRIQIILSGKPVAKKRPRFTRKGAYRAYDVQKQESEQAKAQILAQIPKEVRLNPFSGPLRVILTFYTDIPQSWSKKKRKEAYAAPDTRVPDLDNYIKFYSDVLNGIVYTDDKQIFYIEAYKFHSDRPRTEISIEEVSE